MQEWLEIQGAKNGDYILYSVRGYVRLKPHGKDSRYPFEEDIANYDFIHIYRLTDGELKRVDKPVYSCACGQNTTNLAGWQVADLTVKNAVVCPDCQKKKTLHEDVSIDVRAGVNSCGERNHAKMQVKPCPRCGSKDLKIFLVHDDERKDYWHIRCLNCTHCDNQYGWKSNLYADKPIKYTDITDSLEVSDE